MKIPLLGFSEQTMCTLFNISLRCNAQIKGRGFTAHVNLCSVDQYITSHSLTSYFAGMVGNAPLVWTFLFSFHCPCIGPLAWCQKGRIPLLFVNDCNSFITPRGFFKQKVHSLNQLIHFIAMISKCNISSFLFVLVFKWVRYHSM